MIDISKGRWWDQGIMLVQGCTKCSPGCDNCWSIPLTRRFQHEHKIAAGKNWTGNIRTRPDMLKRFNTHKPKVFAIWNDLFHEAVGIEFQTEVYRKMVYPGNDKNTYLILTKRPKNMFDVVTDFSGGGQTWRSQPNIWHGLTVCNQQEADEKIPIFLQVPGKKFLSIEPMLGAIDLYLTRSDKIIHILNKTNYYPGFEHSGQYDNKIDAVILGGETGPGARPMHPDWVRSVRDQCRNAGVPFFFKQWGEWVPTGKNLLPTKFKDAEMEKVGRKKAGRLLDGRTHDDLPWRVK